MSQAGGSGVSGITGQWAGQRLVGPLSKGEEWAAAALEMNGWRSKGEWDEDTGQWGGGERTTEQPEHQQC